MTTGAGQAGKAMDELGLSAFDSDGKFKGLGQVFKDLSGKLEGMTDEQKNYYLAMIGGKTQVDALQKILAGVGDEYEDLKGKIKDSEGALTTMADVMNDNSKGGIAQLKSALEEAGIAIYTNLKPAIEQVTNAVQGAVDWFNNLDEGTRENIVKFGMLALGAGVVLMAIGMLLPIIASAITVFGALSTAGITLGAIMAFLSSPIMIVIGVIALLVAGCALLKKAWDTNFGGIRDKTQVVMDFVKEKINSIKEVFETVKQKCTEFAESVKDNWSNIMNFLKNPIKGTVELVQNTIVKKAKEKKGDGGRSAYGTRRVAGNDVPYRLHDGERVLTANEARMMDRGALGGASGVTVNVSSLVVREEADIDRVANALVRKINQNRIVLG